MHEDNVLIRRHVEMTTWKRGYINVIAIGGYDRKRARSLYDLQLRLYDYFNSIESRTFDRRNRTRIDYVCARASKFTINRLIRRSGHKMCVI